MRHVPDAIAEFLIHFHGDRDWFECHEILEEYWKERAGATEAEAATLVGLIQVAVGLYHERRGNRAGAIKMLAGSLCRLDRTELAALGLEADELLTRVGERLAQLEHSGAAPFTDLDFPFADNELEAWCRSISEARGWGWKLPSRMDDPDLVDRHTRRDRTGVVLERERSRQAKRAARSIGDATENEHGK